MTEGAQIAERATVLRTAFDRAFAAPVHIDTTARHDLLAVRVGPERCAIRLAEVAGLFVDRRITRMPVSDARLLGIASFRGAIVPVYSLAVLLGHPPTPGPRWLVIGAEAPVAFAFELFESHLRVSADEILPQQSDTQRRGHAPDFVRGADAVRAVLRLHPIIAALGKVEPAGAPA